MKSNQSMSENTSPSLTSSNIRFVLVRTSHPGNIGAAARAMRTMGHARLVLVAPLHYPHADVTALAAGADDVLENIVVVPDLATAIADCRLVLGCTARQRGVPLPEISPRIAAERLQQASSADEVALVFGNERSGLENEELMRCHAAVHIPSVADFSSLNLAQAVQVLAYELRLAALQGVALLPPPLKSDPVATAAEMEYFFAHLAQTLIDIDFHKGRAAVTIERRLRRLFQRAEPEQRELRILRGIFDDAQRMARLATGNEQRSREKNTSVDDLANK